MAARLRRALNVFDDLEGASRALAKRFVTAAAGRERFMVALSGGNTPRTFYRLLGTEYREDVAWERVHLFWADERYVPPDDTDSNVGMIRRELVEPSGISSENVHAPRTEDADPDVAARAYENVLRDALGPSLRFDWILLGLGEDGHVASLFPGHPARAERARLVVAVMDSPKPPPVRLTMTLPLINRAREIHILVAGGAKRRALRQLILEPSPEWLHHPTIWANSAAVDQ